MNMVYTNVSWDTTNSNDVLISTNTVKNNSGTESWAPYSRSSQTFIMSDNPKAKFTVSNSSSSVAFGIGEDPLTASPNFYAIEYSFRLSSGTWYADIGSNSGVATGSYQTSDYFEIEIKSNGVTWRINGTTVHYYGTQPFQTSDTLYVHAVLKSTTTVVSAQFDHDNNSGGSSGGSGGSSSGGDVIQGEGQILDHILFMQTVVPR